MRRLIGAAAALGLAACGGGEGNQAGQPATPRQARDCLAAHEDFRIQGPHGRSPDDTDAPDQTIVVGGREATAYLGFYGDAGRADAAAPEQEQHAKQFKGSVERHGTLSIIWVRGRETGDGASIRACALG